MVAAKDASTCLNMQFLHLKFYSNAVSSTPSRLRIACSSQKLQEISTGSNGRSLNSPSGQRKEKNKKKNTKSSHQGHIALCWSAKPPTASARFPAENIWNSEQATIVDHRPGIRKATPALWRSLWLLRNLSVSNISEKTLSYSSLQGHAQ